LININRKGKKREEKSEYFEREPAEEKRGKLEGK